MTTLDAPPRRPPAPPLRAVADRPEEIVPAGRTWWDRWWVAALVLPLMIASDWKLRRRASAAALSGQADIQVVVEIGFYGLVAAYLTLRHGVAPRLRRTTPLMFALWLWGGVLFFSAFYAVYPALAIARGVQIIIMCALAQTISSRATVAQMHRFAHAYMVMIAVAVVLGFALPLPISSKVAGRFHWLYVHPVPGGIYLMIGFIVSAVYFRSAELRGVLSLWPRWVYGGLTSVTLVALVLTKTRGSIGGGFIALGAVLLFHTRTKTKVDVGAAGFTVALLAGLALGPQILSYLARGESVQKLSTLNERTNLWALAWTKFQVHPFFGYGLGASRGIFLEDIRLGGGHNAFINALVDAGGVGLLSFLAVLVILVATLWRFQRGTPGHRDALLLLPVMVGLLVNSMTAEFMAVPANNASLWLFIAVAWATILQRANASYAAAT